MQALHPGEQAGAEEDRRKGAEDHRDHGHEDEPPPEFRTARTPREGGVLPQHGLDGGHEAEVRSRIQGAGHRGGLTAVDRLLLIAVLLLSIRSAGLSVLLRRGLARLLVLALLLRVPLLGGLLILLRVPLLLSGLALPVLLLVVLLAVLLLVALLGLVVLLRLTVLLLVRTLSLLLPVLLGLSVLLLGLVPGLLTRLLPLLGRLLGRRTLRGLRGDRRLLGIRLMGLGLIRHGLPCS